MQKCDAPAVRTGARLGIDQPHARGGEGTQPGFEVGHTQRHVVQAGAAPGKEARDGGIVGVGRDQLDPAIARAEEDDVDALVGHALGSAGLGAGEKLESGNGGRQIRYGDRYVIYGVFQLRHRAG